MKKTELENGKLEKKHLKKLVLLHSNDLHGDFLAEEMDTRLVGGVSMLSGYVAKVRGEEEHVLYAISGDMLRGSVIDSEYKGLSTMELMNLLAPDVAAIGNHEVDYGVAHLLFLEKCARFPLINANMYLTGSQVRLFRPHWIRTIGGMKVLFIGVLTEETLAQTRQEELIGSMIDIRDAVQEIGKVCNCYRTTDIDLTVLLTHIGIEEDKKLARALNPDWGVDLIIGGHSHTFLAEPVVEAGIPIVQAADGTNQIGRFDLLVDTEKNRVESFRWKLISIEEDTCPRDSVIEQVIQNYKKETDSKYGRIVTRFEAAYTHPVRNQETELGRIFSDIFKESLGIDIMFLASGSIRSKSVPAAFRYQDLLEVFPFDEAVYGVTVTGNQLKRMLTWMLREETFSAHTEFYQLSRGIRVVYSREKREILSLEYEGKPVEEAQLFQIGLHEFHYENMGEFLKVLKEEAEANRPVRKLSTSSCDILEEWMSKKERIRDLADERIVILP